MGDSRFAVIDPAAGVSGDMLLGALVELGAPAAWLAGLPARLGLPGVSVAVEEVERCHVRCTKVTVRLPGDLEEGPARAFGEPASADSHRHDAGHGALGHHGPHRHVGELLERIAHAPLSAWVQERATAAFRLLGEAEGRVHGVAPEAVALHEVGAWDALVDIVGVVEGFEQLGIDRIATRPVAVGSGWITVAHGTMPVPAPATALLLEGLPLGPDGPVIGEAVTPTGAALLRALVNQPIPSHWRAVRHGWGAGLRNPGTYPNACRILLGEGADEAESVFVVATDVDDLSPEYLEPLRDALMTAGALDVQVWSTQAKKGRLSFRVEALTAVARLECVTQAFFAHSTTAGVRRWPVSRVTLARRHASVGEGEDMVRIKIVDGPGGPRVKPEYDDVHHVARRTGRPALDVAEDMRSLAWRAFGAPPETRAHKESE